jgi:hypothetical protein
LTTSDGTNKGWTLSSGSGSPGFVTGRYGGQALGYSQGRGTLYRTAFSTPQSTVYMGMAIKINSTTIDSVGASSTLFTAVSNSGITFNLSMTSGGLETYCNYGSPATQTITGFINPLGAWTYLEVEIIASTGSGTANGTIVVRQDGTQIYSNTAIFTCYGTNFTQIAYGIPQSDTSGALYSYIDDLYYSFNGFCGPLRVATMEVASDASGQQWNPSTGSAHYSLVNSSVRNSGTSYVSATTGNQSDFYGIGSLPSSGVGAPLAVQPVVALSGQGDTISTAIKSSGTLAQSSYVPCPIAVGLVAPGIWNTDPATGAAWTAAGVNALLVGMENGNP